jgi:hypothetical protein
MGMEVRAHRISLSKHWDWAEQSDDFSLKADIVAEEELSCAIAELRLWLDPFLLVAWVREEAQALGCSARMEETFDQPAECGPRILLGVLAYAYAMGVFSSEEIVRNCRTNSAFGALSEGKFLFRQELTRFRRRHRALLTELLARIFVRSVSERFGFSQGDVVLPYIKTCTHQAAIQRLDIARHLDTSDE